MLEGDPSTPITLVVGNIIQETTFRVLVKTGEDRTAGTDANVYITLFGDKGDSGKRPLSAQGKDCFERSKTDVFGFECVEIGNVTKIVIGHVNNNNLFLN